MMPPMFEWDMEVLALFDREFMPMPAQEIDQIPGGVEITVQNSRKRESPDFLEFFPAPSLEIRRQHWMIRSVAESLEKKTYGEFIPEGQMSECLLEAQRTAGPAFLARAFPTSRQKVLQQAIFFNNGRD
jgi:hypothetical protein